jgi:hypothetical protein
MSEFWIFTLSGAVVAWVPLLVGFVVQHWRLRVYIDRRTNTQTSAINGHVQDVTTTQTRELLKSRVVPPPRRRRRDTRYDDC